MRILFVNQYAPPDPAPTSRLLGDLAENLSACGWEVSWAADKASYHRRKNGFRRWLAEALVHLKLFWMGLVCPKPDLILSLTSPVCLVATASLLARLRGTRHVHWAMDLYPDLALALHEVKEGPVTRVLEKIMRKAYQSTDRIISLDEDMQFRLLDHYGVSSGIIPPWPGRVEAADLSRPSGQAEGWSWLYSGNLGRAHEWECLLQVQAGLEKEGVPATLIFQGDGAEIPKAKERAAELGLRRCLFRGYTEPGQFLESLLAASVLIATRKPVACGLLWPSKLALLQGLPRPLLWVGDTESRLAEHLKKRRQTGVFSPLQADAIKQWLLAVVGVESPEPPMLFDPENLRMEGLRCWNEELRTNTR